MKVCCLINKNDDFTVDDSEILNFFDKSHLHYTFFNVGSLRNFYRLERFFNHSAIDLYYLSIAIYFADRIKLRKDSDDGWTREFTIYLPVLCLNEMQSVTKKLKNLIEYLTGDKWNFELRRRIGLNTQEERIKKGVERARKKAQPEFFSMLSGGLDSYIGAIDLLEKNLNVFFVSHYGGGKGVKDYQDLVRKNLTNNYNISKTNFFSFHLAALNGIEDTTRSRSFMFFMHALVIASQVENSIEILVPENGFISLNIPFTNSRLGSNSTRTTHPYYINLLNKIIEELNIKIKFVNPYQFNTKGEMIENCLNKILLNSTIIETMSCSHPDQGRYNGIKSPTHCGVCLPCIIRRASINKGIGVDPTSYLDKHFLGDQAKLTLRSLKIGILDFERSVNTSFLKILASGNLPNKNPLFNKIYKNGMLEVKQLLDEYKG